MHAFALLMKALMGHPWAKEAVTRAQRLVTFFRASNRIRALLQNFVPNQKPKTLLSANKTRFTSVEASLTSVMGLKYALKSLMQWDCDEPKQIIPQWVHTIVADDRGLWEVLEVLLAVLVPYSQVIMAAQSDMTTLSDMPRYWGYLGRQMVTASKMRNADTGR